ncbi:LysR substrate-binding domain-containing protein [Pseudomonas viridiflava]|uniref:LysR substrate-binding domain-containing protein n=1 Tax=Pseudomonas viridiflava TaxID=33069 RepID=UPI003C6DBFC6
MLEFGSYHAIMACVAAGTGIGIISEVLLDNAVLSDSVQRHPSLGILARSRTHLVWSGEVSPPLKAFMALLPTLNM